MPCASATSFSQDAYGPIETRRAARRKTSGGRASSGGPPYQTVAMNKVGCRFAHDVVDAMTEGTVDRQDASVLLGVGGHNVGKFVHGATPATRRGMVQEALFEAQAKYSIDTNGIVTFLGDGDDELCPVNVFGPQWTFLEAAIGAGRVISARRVETELNASLNVSSGPTGHPTW